MNLQQLRVFHAAAVSKSFTRAAELLHLSQSTVSLHVKELEDELECALFLRVGRRVVLSQTGALLLDYVEKILRDLKNAEMAVREMNAVQRGTVHLGTGATTLMYRLSPVLAAIGNVSRKSNCWWKPTPQSPCSAASERSAWTWLSS